MEHESHDHIKHREIGFCSLHADTSQAQTAMLLFSDVKGILNLRLVHEHRIQISYDIRHLSLQMLEDVLTELGFHLDNSLLYKLKRALYYYTEEVQRENLGIGHADSNSTRKIFISRYSRLEHGCRDERPAHWRKYL